MAKSKEKKEEQIIEQEIKSQEEMATKKNTYRI